MKVNTYVVLEDCVEKGVSYGYNRAFKYENAPSEASIKDSITQEVMTSISEYFSWDDE